MRQERLLSVGTDGGGYIIYYVPIKMISLARVLPPLPISAGTGGGVRRATHPARGFVPVVLISECIRSWGPWHVDGS